MTLRWCGVGFLIFLGLTVSTLPAQAALALPSSAAAQRQPKPLSAEDHLKRGDELRSERNWDGAIAEYRDAVRLNPKNGDPHYNLGVVLEKKRDLEGALNEYRAAYSLNPQNAGFKENYERLLSIGTSQGPLLRLWRYAAPHTYLLVVLLFLAVIFGLALRGPAKRREVERAESVSRRKLSPGATTSEDIAQPWSPPPELLLPTPRPIKGKGVAVFRYLRILGGYFFFFGGIPLIAWILSGLSRSPGATVGAKWERYVEGGPYEWLNLALVVYAGGFVVWLFYYLWYRKAERLLKWGKPARAVVTRVWERYDPKKGSSSSYWESQLEYHDDAGNLVKRTVRRRLPKDRVLTVLYGPGKPKKFTVYPVAGYEVGGG